MSDAWMFGTALQIRVVEGGHPTLLATQGQLDDAARLAARDEKSTNEKRAGMLALAISASFLVGSAITALAIFLYAWLHTTPS